MCDKGYCLREGPTMDRLRKLTDNKKNNATMDTVQRAIATWESHVADFMGSTDKVIGKDQMKMCLE